MDQVRPWWPKGLCTTIKMLRAGKLTDSGEEEYSDIIWPLARAQYVMEWLQLFHPFCLYNPHCRPSSTKAIAARMMAYRDIMRMEERGELDFGQVSEARYGEQVNLWKHRLGVTDAEDESYLHLTYSWDGRSPLESDIRHNEKLDTRVFMITDPEAEGDHEADMPEVTLSKEDLELLELL